MKRLGERMARVLFSAAIVVALAAMLGGCTDEGAAYGTLDGAGYTEIKLTGYQYVCGKDDTCTGFEAKGPTGRKVVGGVGCGFWNKGCTIRITGVSR